MPAADGHDASAPGGHRIFNLGRKEPSSLASDHIIVWKDFDLHGGAS
jgi:hypothetical protein